MSSIELKVTDLINELIEKMGYELADVEYLKEDGQMCLNIYIYKENMGVQDCEEVSRAVDPVLDEADITKGAPYFLCVSTLGDRPFKNDRDYIRNIDKMIELKPKKPIGKVKHIVGTLVSFDSENIVLDKKGEQTIIKRQDILSARPYFGF